MYVSAQNVVPMGTLSCLPTGLEMTTVVGMSAPFALL